MRIKSSSFIWVVFFAGAIFLLNEVAQLYVEPREIRLSEQQAYAIGQKIWMNEGAGKPENLIVWNEGEDFPSLGIGHFIWYPEGVEHRFVESFPGLLRYIGARRELPSWLTDQVYAPWNSRAEFLRDKDSKYATNLRVFLQETVSEQTQYIVKRLESALPKMLKEIKNPFAKRHVRENFYHVAMQENGVYALIDYVNFKGEGVSPEERYNGLGWGLLQVLERMSDSNENVMSAFAEAADFVLTRRVENAPRDEARWLPGWRKRLNTYKESVSYK